MQKPLRCGQIYRDFHTSEHFPGIGAAFDPESFVATLMAAHMDSTTIFARRHHGGSDYPTKKGTPEGDWMDDAE